MNLYFAKFGGCKKHWEDLFSIDCFLLGNFYADVGALAIFHLPNVPYNHKTWRSKDVDKKFILN